MERLEPFLTGNFYHLYNRGVDKRKIFFKDNDYKIFQRLLYIRNSNKRIDLTRVYNKTLSEIDRPNTLVDIIAYALMPNHFHLLVHEKNENGISKFMAKHGTSFSMYMNTKYDRTGPLMCRPFRSKLIDSDDYLRWLICYIHLNPCELVEKRKQNKFITSYKYSSYCDYLNSTNENGKREECLILNLNSLPDGISDKILHLNSMKELPEEKTYPNVLGLP